MHNPLVDHLGLAFAHITSCRNNIRWSYHRTRCERAAVCLCVLVVCLSRDCPPFVDHLGLDFVVLLAMHTRSCTGMGSNRARYLLSACALVVSPATGFESRFVYKARYVFVSRRPHLQNLPPPSPSFCRSDSRHQAHREYRHQARSFLTALLFTPERRIKPHFPHKHLWIYRVLFSHRTT